MPRISKRDRIALWLERLNRYHQCGRSAAEFCLAEGVSLPSFYQWKRRLSPTIATEKPTGVETTKSSTGFAKANFTELTVSATQLVSSRIRLARDVVIELGTEQATATAIVAQVLDRCLPSASESPSC